MLYFSLTLFCDGIIPWETSTENCLLVHGNSVFPILPTIASTILTGDGEGVIVVVSELGASSMDS